MEEKIKELELKIAKEIENCDRNLKEGEELKKECVSLIIEEIKDKTVKEIESFVKTDIENTNNLGVPKLSEMKKEMNDLINSIDNSTDVINSNNDIWILSIEFIKDIDFSKDTFNIRYNSKNNIIQNTKKFIKTELMKIGDILIKYNYLDNEKKKHSNIFNSSYGTSLSDNLNDTIKKYSDVFEGYVKSNEFLYRYQRDLEQTKALYLWEQA